ncbi:hypothetical protein D9Q98_003482 [Chlorella vulgaris]|uniref:Uncharacterized protein n=1 Tax=Chlorella vulgaris TaxID=3077 RepID=A0A9D4TT81_CHLVU|nr:hypothetical protein D9Q98_003482 [Chlorella vulgaris]
MHAQRSDVQALLADERGSPRTPLHNADDKPPRTTTCRREAVLALAFSLCVVAAVASRSFAASPPWLSSAQQQQQSQYHQQQRKPLPAPKPGPQNCGATALPHLCCGVCQFERRLCSSSTLPSRISTAQVAAQLAGQHRRLQDVTPCELFQRIRGRTLWLLGDSQTWSLFTAAECFLREFAPSLQRTDPLPSKQLNDLLTVAEATHCNAPYPVPPLCLELVLGTRICVVRVDYAQHMRRFVLPALMQHVPRFKRDLVVMNAGLHYTRDVSCVEGICQVPGPESRYVRELRKLVEWRAPRRNRLPKTVWMETAPQHFPGTGYWTGSYRVTQGQSCEPLAAWQRGAPVELAGGNWNAAAAQFVPGLADAHLRIWNASAPLWDSHLPDECTHWCHPGAYQLWLYLLNDLLRVNALGNPVAVQGP